MCIYFLLRSMLQRENTTKSKQNNPIHKNFTVLGYVIVENWIFFKNVLFHFCDFPTFTNSTNLQIINKL